MNTVVLELFRPIFQYIVSYYVKLLSFCEHSRIGFIIDQSFNIQYHTLGVNKLRMDEDDRLVIIFDQSFSIQYHTTDLK